MMTVYWPNGMKMHSLEDWVFDSLTGQELLNRHYDETRSWSFLVYPGRIRYTMGNSKDTKYALLTPNIGMDVGRIKKLWYQSYCESHGYIIMENYMTALNTVQIAIRSFKSEMENYKAEKNYIQSQSITLKLLGE